MTDVIQPSNAVLGAAPGAVPVPSGANAAPGAVPAPAGANAAPGAVPAPAGANAAPAPMTEAPFPCNAPYNRFTYECPRGTGKCAATAPCILFTNTCNLSCFSPADDTNIAVNIKHGSYKSYVELRDGGKPEWANVSEWDYAGSGGNETSNDNLNFIDVLNPRAKLRVFSVAGGANTKWFKGYVVNATMATGLLLNSSVESISFQNVNYNGSSPPLAHVLPTTVTDLTMDNVLMSEVPTDLGKFQSLKTVSFRGNYLTKFPTDITFPNLTDLNLADNQLIEFNSAITTLVNLNLTGNNLTKIPDMVYKQRRLSQLCLERNPLSSIQVAEEQYETLRSLQVAFEANLEADPGCVGKVQPLKELKGYNMSVCVTSTASKKPNQNTLIIGISCGVIVLVIIAVFAFVHIRKKKQQRGLKTTTNGSSEMDMFFRGLYEEGGDDPDDDHVDDPNGSNHTALYGTLVTRRLDLNDIEDVRCVGSGGFGKVWLVIYQGTTQLASKRLINGAATEDRERFVKEIQLNASLSHSRIVKFVGVAWNTGRDLQALFEYMARGDLRTWLTDATVPKRWTVEKVHIAADIIEALLYVHSFQPALVHRDLKSRNVLLANDMHAKLCDFGIARFKSTQQTMTIAMGTGLWIAPEIIACRRDYDQFADIYSFGVVLSELDTHQLPYEDVKAPNGDPLPEFGIMYRVGEGSLRPSFSPHCPSPILDLANRCLSFDPTNRPTAIEVAHSLGMIQRWINK